MHLTDSVGLSTAGAEPRPAAAAGVEAWFSPKVFAIFTGLLLCLTFPEIIAGTKSFFFRDYGVLAYPTIFYAKQSLWQGELPFWNPYSHCGVPFLAQWGPMVLYPFSVIYLLLPLPWSLGIFCLAHLWLGAMGMYFLAHRWTASRFGAAIAGLGFIFNGLIFSTLAWPNYTVALGWMPWVVLCVEQAWREGGRRIPIAALVGTMQMLSGVPEIILLTWFFVVLHWCCEVGRGVPTEPCKSNPARLGLTCLRLLGIVLLVGALSSVQLLPFFDLLAHSHRDTNFGTSAWAMPAWGWANLVVPLFHCIRSPQGVFYQPNHVFLTSYYLGIGTLALAVLALLGKRDRRLWCLAGATVFSLVMALGDDGYVFAWLKQALPALGYARFPIKFVYLAAFTLPLLAAFGIAAVQQDATTPAGKAPTRLLWVSGILLMTMAVLVGFCWRSPLPGEQWTAAAGNAVWRVIVLVALTAGLCLFRHAASTRLQGILPYALGVVVWLDGFTATPNGHPVIAAEALAPAMTQLTPRPRLGEGRAMLSPVAEDRMARSGVEDFQQDYVGKRLGLWSNLNLLDLVPKVEGASTLTLREQAQWQRILYSADQADFSALKDFLGVSQTTAPDRIIEWAVRTNAMPWVTMGQEPVFVEASKNLWTLASQNFEPRRQVYLPVEAKGQISAVRCPDAQVRQKEFTPHRIVLQAEASQPAMVVLAQSYYHRWQAYVDGQPAPIWRANHSFQALQIPAGRHEVVLAYRDPLFAGGATFSAITALACFVWIGRSRKKMTND